MTGFTLDQELALHRMHKRIRELQQRTRFSRARSSDPRKELAGFVEYQALAQLRGMGLRVSRRGYNDHCDIWCEGISIEVKAASWSSGRYQAAIRNHDADLLLLGCKTPDEKLIWFVIPAGAYADVSHISIWTEDPTASNGQWIDYLDAWWHLDAALMQAPKTPGQLTLLEV